MFLLQLKLDSIPAKNDSISKQDSTILKQKLKLSIEAANVQLFTAVENWDLEGVKKALNNKAEINATKDGDTPLIIAVKFGFDDIAQYLIEQKANVNARDKDDDPINGKTPLDYAETYRRYDIIQILKDNGAKKAAEL